MPFKKNNKIRDFQEDLTRLESIIDSRFLEPQQAYDTHCLKLICQGMVFHHRGLSVANESEGDYYPAVGADESILILIDQINRELHYSPQNSIYAPGIQWVKAIMTEFFTTDPLEERSSSTGIKFNVKSALRVFFSSVEKAIANRIKTDAVSFITEFRAAYGVSPEQLLVLESSDLAFFASHPEGFGILLRDLTCEEVQVLIGLEFMQTILAKMRTPEHFLVAMRCLSLHLRSRNEADATHLLSFPGRDAREVVDPEGVKFKMLLSAQPIRAKIDLLKDERAMVNLPMGERLLSWFLRDLVEADEFVNAPVLMFFEVYSFFTCDNLGFLLFNIASGSWANSLHQLLAMRSIQVKMASLIKSSRDLEHFIQMPLDVSIREVRTSLLAGPEIRERVLWCLNRPQELMEVLCSFFLTKEHRLRLLEIMFLTMILYSFKRPEVIRPSWDRNALCLDFGHTRSLCALFERPEFQPYLLDYLSSLLPGDNLGPEKLKNLVASISNPSNEKQYGLSSYSEFLFLWLFAKCHHEVWRLIPFFKTEDGKKALDQLLIDQPGLKTQGWMAPILCAHRDTSVNRAVTTTVFAEAAAAARMRHLEPAVTEP